MTNPSPIQDLATFQLPADFRTGRPLLPWILWQLSGEWLLASALPGSTWRRFILRRFGAQIGAGVVLKPRIRIKFPWRLSVGSHTWIGEGVWIDNPHDVLIGRNVCISQGVYFCTGNHDYREAGFGYRLAPIIIDDEAWICAMARVAPGVHMGQGAVLGFASVGQGQLPAFKVLSGCPARVVADRLPATEAAVPFA
ncbi:MAG: WcaF family extracellular polysaccharide biosynthesis acetyltransferase [Cyanobacteriota bacterium]|nr:WcaF family extracellular polysaccharide biosynthesis acetyltransferase [Cyanobacteriota bacterium]